MSGQLTIIMIAHRLNTIQTADNLLYVENPRSILAGAKGTPEYKELMDKLKSTNYAHQVKDEKEVDPQDSVDSDELEDEANQS